MEIYKATIVRGANNTILAFTIKNKRLDIILTEDKPGDVKAVFNSLLMELKHGEFSFELDDPQEDLYHHISKEYIVQLNSELKSVFNELKDFDLLAKPKE